MSIIPSSLFFRNGTHMLYTIQYTAGSIQKQICHQLSPPPPDLSHTHTQRNHIENISRKTGQHQNNYLKEQATQSKEAMLH